MFCHMDTHILAFALWLVVVGQMLGALGSHSVLVVEILAVGFRGSCSANSHFILYSLLLL